MPCIVACGADADTDASPAGAPAGSCAELAADVCAMLPAFTASEQNIDGIGDEFCDVAGATYVVRDMPWVNPYFATNLPAVATLRAGWSDAAFHAHVHVTDPIVSAASDQSPLWDGDNVQFYVAGTDTLTGFYGDGEDGGAVHVTVSAPAWNAPKGKASVSSQTRELVETPLDPAAFAGRLVADGYEVEVRLPWADNAAPRSSGARVGFNFSIGVSDERPAAIELEGVLRNNPAPTPIICMGSGNSQTPGCDDRTWCTPELE